MTPWTVAHQASLSMEFSRQESWSGLAFVFPGDLTNPGMEPGSPELQADSLPSEPPGKTSLYLGQKKERKNVKLLSSVQLFMTPWTAACQVPLSMEFSRQESWSGQPFSSPRGSSRPRDQTRVYFIAGGSFYCQSRQGSPHSQVTSFICYMDSIMF